MLISYFQPVLSPRRGRCPVSDVAPSIVLGVVLCSSGDFCESHERSVTSRCCLFHCCQRLHLPWCTAVTVGPHFPWCTASAAWLLRLVLLLLRSRVVVHQGVPCERDGPCDGEHPCALGSDGSVQTEHVNEGQEEFQNKSTKASSREKAEEHLDAARRSRRFHFTVAFKLFFIRSLKMFF